MKIIKKLLSLALYGVVGFVLYKLLNTDKAQEKLFEYLGEENNRHKVRARKGFSMIGYTKMDLGIAKYHFEIGAGNVNFDWVVK